MVEEAVCAICGGTGWRILERDGISAAERCNCALEQRSRELLGRAQIPPLYQNASIENFLLPKDNPVAERGLAQVMTKVKGFVREYPALDRPGLLLLGEPGTGKTHLAVAALRGLIERGFEGLFFDYQNLLERIRSSYDPNSNSADREAFRTALETPVLLLDDLGAHRVTDWVEDTVTSILTYRCNQKKTLIATSNLADPDAGGSITERSAAGMEVRDTLAKRLGMRARSRLFEMCRVIRMPAVEDYRIRRNKLS